MKLSVIVGVSLTVVASSAKAELLSKVDWANSFESPISAQGNGRADDFKKFRAAGKKSNDKDLAAWLEQKVTASVGKPTTFEIKDCDKTARHGQYDQEALHNRLMQAVVGEIDAIARFPEGKTALQSKFKGVKMECVADDVCEGSTQAERIKCKGPAYIYDNGYYYVHYQVGDAGEALPYPSSAAKLDNFRYDESSGPSLQTQLAVDLVKKYLSQYQKAINDAFGAPLDIEIDWNQFLRTSKALPGYPMDGGWATDSVQDGLEELLLRMPSWIKEYYRQADQYYKDEIPLVKKNLKKIKIVMGAPENDSPQTQEFKGGVLIIHGRWQSALGVSDTDIVPVILSASGKAH